jgi:hypothetical protein
MLVSANFFAILAHVCVILILICAVVTLFAVSYYLANCKAVDMFFGALLSVADYFADIIKNAVISTIGFFDELYANHCPPIVLEKEETEEVPE